MDPRHYLSRSSSRQSQSQSDEDPSRQVDQETYQGDFATMDPAMQVLLLYSLTIYEVGLWLICVWLIAAKCILDDRRWTWDVRGDTGYATRHARRNAGHIPGDATGIDTDAAGHAAGEGRWKGYDGTIEPDDEYVEHSGGG